MTTQQCEHRSQSDRCPYQAEFQVLFVEDGDELDWASVCSLCLPGAVRLATRRARRVSVRLLLAPAASSTTRI